MRSSWETQCSICEMTMKLYSYKLYSMSNVRLSGDILKIFFTSFYYIVLIFCIQLLKADCCLGEQCGPYVPLVRSLHQCESLLILFCLFWVLLFFRKQSEIFISRLLKKLWCSSQSIWEIIRSVDPASWKHRRLRDCWRVRLKVCYCYSSEAVTLTRCKP